MRLIRRPFLLLFVLLLVLPLGLALLALQTQPSLAAGPSELNLSGAQASRARQLWAQIDPRGLPAGARRVLRLTESDLNTLLAAAAARPDRRLHVALSPGGARLDASWQLGRWPGQPWLNLQLDWEPPPLESVMVAEWPRLRAARIGRLPLPSAWVESLARGWMERQYGTAALEALDMVERWRFEPGAVRVRWRWQPEQASAALAGLWPAPLRSALLAQHQAWWQFSANRPPGAEISLVEALPPLAQAALQRVRTQAAEPEVELRALLLQLLMRSLGRDLNRLLPDAHSPVHPALQLRLAGREDMPQHFLLAAWLSWGGGHQFTQALGLAKELADARGGSGFSFNDLAADLAGDRFGDLCEARPLAVLQALARPDLSEPQLFPRIDDLPEFLSDAEFRQRYGGVGAPAYGAEMARIRARVDALPFHRGLRGNLPLSGG